jgi:PAS domain S-box-containing protein
MAPSPHLVVPSVEPPRGPESVRQTSRLILIVASVLHPAWYVLMRFAAPEGHDSLRDRLLLAAVSLLALALSYHPRLQAGLVVASHGVLWVMTAHVFWLVALNAASAVYLISLFILLAAVSISFFNLRAVILYAVFVVGLALATATLAETPPSAALLLAGVLATQGVIVAAAWRRSLAQRSLAAELRDSRDLFSTLLDTLPDPVFAKQPGGGVTLANDAFCAMLRRPREAVLGRSAEELVMESMVLSLREHETRALATDEAFEVEDSWTDRRGAQHVVSTKLRKIELGLRGPTLVGVVRDITARKQMERALAEAESRLSSAFDHAPVGMALVSTDGRPRRVNGVFCDLVGREESALIDRDIADCAHPDDRAALHALFQRLAAGTTETCTVEQRWVHASGRLLRVLVGASVAPVGTDRATCIVHVVDWTARHQTQMHLQHALDEAEAATRAKSEFLAKMSHEIRTPINGVVAAIDLAARGPTGSEQAEHLGIARRSALDLTAILSDILDLSRLEAGPVGLVRTPFRLRRAVESAMVPLAPWASEKGLAFEVDLEETVPDVLVGDELRWRQVLVNLVGNAIKFTERGRVYLHLSASPVEDGEAELTLEVVDTGVGIEPDRQARILEPFVQADDSIRRRYGGTGLGLAIVAQIVDQMGGRLQVRSQPGQGSTFRLTARLPVARPEDVVASPSASSPPEPIDPSQVAGIAVLVVDDNPVNLRLAQRHLQLAGFAVETATGGMQTLETVRARRFDVVLLDVQMPEMDGFATARALRAEHPEDCPALLAVTAQAMPGDRERCLEAGMDGYLAKPVEFDVLAAEVVRLAMRTAAPVRHLTPSQDAAVAGDPVQRALARMDRLVDGDRELVAELVELFEAGRDASISAVRAAIREEACEALALAAHRLKGSLLHVGADEAAELARRIELLGRAGWTRGADELLTQLEQEVALVVPGLLAAAANSSHS